jgi:serine/threonine protein kinase
MNPKPELWQRLKPLHEAALDTPKEERAAFVAQNCGEDSELREALERLLADHEEGTGTLDQPVFNIKELLSGAGGVFSEGELVLNRFRIIRLLGAGGMGEVYEAVDGQLGRIALKTIFVDIAGSPGRLVRFRKEVQLARSVSSPHVCRIHDLFLTDGPERAFVTMEFLNGITLADKIGEAGPLPWRDARQIALELCRALQSIHKAGIVHCDLKGRNIMLATRNDATCAVLMDFGIARRLSPHTRGTSTFITEAGAILGTPDYMAPEQFEGKEATPATDIYAFGIVFYELLTGKNPFSRELSTGNTVNAPKPLIRPSSVRAGVPRRLDEVVCKCLEYDPKRRYQSANEVERAIRFPSIVVRLQQRPVTAALGVLAFVLVLFSAWHFRPHSVPFTSVSINQITNIGTIERIALSADGRFLAEVRNDKEQRTLWVRNTATSTDTRILDAFGNQYVGLTFSPDSNYLYLTRGTPGDDTTRNLYVMSVFGGTPRRLIVDIDSRVSFAPDGNRFTYVRWSPDRKDQYSEVHIARKDGSDDRVIYTTVEQTQAPVWSPDGSRLAWLQSQPGTTRIALGVLDIASKKLTTVAAPADVFLAAPEDGYITLAWLPDNRHLLALYYKRHTDRVQIGVITTPSGEFHSVTNDVNSYSELALSGDGSTLATVLTDVNSSIAFYRPGSGEPVTTLPLRITPNGIAWATEDRLLYVVEGSGIGSIDRATGSVKSFDVGEIALGNSIATCRDGHILFTGFTRGGGEARIFRMNADGGEISQLTTSGVARAPSCSPDSQDAFFSLGTRTSVSPWSVSVAGGTPKRLVPPDNFDKATVSRDGRLVVLHGLRGQGFCVIIADLATGRMLPPFFLDQSFGKVAKLTPDDRAIVSDVRRNGGNTLLYQPLDGAPPHVLFNPGPERIRDFDWSPSGKQLAVAGLKSSSDVVLITDQSGKYKN